MAVDYNSIIQNATNSYNSAVAGYKSQLAAQQQQQQGVIAGYNNLQAGVLGGLQEQSAVASKQIKDQYDQAAADRQMQMFKMGMGNTSTRINMLNQLDKNQAFAQTNRIGDFAGRAADKTTQLGLAGLGYAGNAIRDNSAFAGQGLQYMGQGALGVANLAQGFAGMQNQAEMQNASFANQKAMQDAQFAQQVKMQKLQQLYGTGGGYGGGGHVSSYDQKPQGGGYGGGGFGAGTTITPYSVAYPAQTPLSDADLSGLAGGFAGASTSGSPYVSDNGVWDTSVYDIGNNWD